jgi:uncharacterized protein (TIGR02246 family)
MSTDLRSRTPELVAFVAATLIGLCASFAVLAQGRPAEQLCAPVTEDEIRSLHDRWLNSLQTKHPDKVTRNYASDAVMLAEATRKVRANYAEIREYFLYFLQLDPQVRIDHRTIRLGCNAASAVGHFSMTINGPTPNSRDVIQGRYSFNYELRDGAWLIVHHHASVMPSGETMIKSESVRDRVAATAKPAAPPPAEAEAASPARAKSQVAGFTRRIIARSTPAALMPKPEQPDTEYRPAKWVNGEMRF